MTAKTRLARIEKRLTPQEVVVAYLDEIMRRFDSYSEWAEWVADRPSEAPLIRVCRAATDAVRNTMRGQPREAVSKAVDHAVREAIFLGKLFLGVTHKLLEDAGYFAGRAILFPEHARLLASVIQTAEVLAEEYNDFARGGAGSLPEDLLIDLEGINRRAAEAVRGEVAYAVQMTKAETLIALGMNGEGCRMAVEAYRGRQRTPTVCQSPVTV